MSQHEPYMQAALHEAQQAYNEGEVPTGCVIVRTHSSTQKRDRIIARAHNQVERLRDPTAHAEMIAITQAAATLGDWRLTNTALYVTKEPCAMCAGAIVLARIPFLIFGVADPKRGGAVSVFNIVQHNALIHRCSVITGVMEQECRSLLQTFFQERRKDTRQSSMTKKPEQGASAICCNNQPADPDLLQSRDVGGGKRLKSKMSQEHQTFFTDRHKAGGIVKSRNETQMRPPEHHSEIEE